MIPDSLFVSSSLGIISVLLFLEPSVGLRALLCRLRCFSSWPSFSMRSFRLLFSLILGILRVHTTWTICFIYPSAFVMWLIGYTVSLTVLGGKGQTIRHTDPPPWPEDLDGCLWAGRLQSFLLSLSLEDFIVGHSLMPRVQLLTLLHHLWADSPRCMWRCRRCCLYGACALRIEKTFVKD